MVVSLEFPLNKEKFILEKHGKSAKTGVICLKVHNSNTCSKMEKKNCHYSIGFKQAGTVNVIPENMQ